MSKSEWIRARWLPAVLCASLWSGAAAFAQTVPNAGQILRENAPAPTSLGEGRATGVAIPTPDRPAVPEGGPQVQVTEIQFTGNEHFLSHELARAVPLVSQAAGRRLDLAGLEAVADAVTRYYHAQGYPVAIAYVEPQKLDNSVVVIKVFEGKLDKTHVASVPGYADERLARYAQQAMCETNPVGCTGAPIRTERVERAANLIRDLPGIADVKGTLSPGSGLGSSDLTLDVVPSPAVTGVIGLDNYGNRYTGRPRLVGNLRLNNLAGFGDVLSIDAVTSGGHMATGGIDYNVPVGYDGWRAGLRYTHLMYRLKAPFDALDAKGRADILGIYATYPLVRSASRNLYFSTGYDSKWMKDEMLDGDSRKHIDAFEVGLAGDEIDGWLGGGMSAFGASLGSGVLSARGLAAAEGGPDGRYTKFKANAWRDQTLAYLSPATRLSLFGSARGQYSGNRLDSVESFAPGGPDGVRAYPTGEAPGERGYAATLELRLSTAVPIAGGSDLTVALFRDMGGSQATTAAGLRNTRHLAGNGISLELSQRKTLRVKLSWAKRDRSRDPATSDADARSRVWLQALFFFP